MVVERYQGVQARAGPVVLTQRGLTAKIMFELRVTNSNQGYTTGLTARSVTILDQASGSDEALKAAWAEDEDVQEFKKRKMAAKAASPPTVAAPAYDVGGDDEY